MYNGPQILKELEQLVDIDSRNLVTIKNKKIIRYAINKNYTNIKYVDNQNLILWTIENYPDSINYTKISFDEIVKLIWRKERYYNEKIHLINSIIDNYSNLTFENLIYCLRLFDVNLPTLKTYNKIITMINNKTNAIKLLMLNNKYIEYINLHNIMDIIVNDKYSVLYDKYFPFGPLLQFIRILDLNESDIMLINLILSKCTNQDLINLKKMDISCYNKYLTNIVIDTNNDMFTQYIYLDKNEIKQYIEGNIIMVQDLTNSY